MTATVANSSWVKTSAAFHCFSMKGSNGAETKTERRGTASATCAAVFFSLRTARAADAASVPTTLPAAGLDFQDDESRMIATAPFHLHAVAIVGSCRTR